MTRRILTPGRAMAEGGVVFAFGACCLFLAVAPSSPGIAAEDPNKAVAKAVVEAVREQKWGLASVTHRWNEAKADGVAEVGPVKEQVIQGGRRKVAKVVMPVKAPPSPAADLAMSGGTGEAWAKRHVEALMVQDCDADGCAPARVEEVKFMATKAMEAIAPEGSIRRSLLDKGTEKVKGFLGRQ